MNLRFRGVGLAVTCVMAVAACGGSAPASTSPTDNSPASLKIMVGGLSKQIYLPNMLAQQLGYFKEQNLTVSLIDEASGQSSEEELLAGNVDAGSGSYNHAIEVQAKGKYIQTVVQFQVAPGEAEVVATQKADTMKTAADMKGKNLGVTSIGSGTHTLTMAIMGKVGLAPTDAKYVAAGAGDGFLAALKQGKIDAGMTTEPTISRALKSGTGKVLVDLRTPTATRAALGGDYPFIGVWMKNDYVKAHPGVVQRLVNAYVKTLKWMKAHTAAEIADKMPADYLAGDKDLYVAALDSQKDSFTADGKMPAGGPQTVLDIELKYVPDMKDAKIDLSKTFTNDFAGRAP